MTTITLFFDIIQVNNVYILMVKNVYDSDSNSVTTSQGRVSRGKMGQKSTIQISCTDKLYANINIIMQVLQTLKDLHKLIKISRQPLWVGWFFQNNKKCPIFPIHGENETHRELTSLSHFNL